uniref:Interleukin 23 receptor n=2 Tax=Homo sapiens TaxID=9606 RepID=A0A8V8TM22_HUMAN
MNQVTIQWDAVIALYILFSWCHGGITNINCSGHIWVEPATIFKMGMNISIYCQAAIKNCQPRKLHFYKNGIKERFQITRINKTTARLWYKNFLEPHASMYCTAECPKHFQETLICGKDISSGYPPDIPDEVTCVIYEYSGNMTCTWNAGKLTYIDTKYVVHVKSLETEEEQQYLTSSYINISTDSLQGGKKYLVWVQAANALGMEESKQLQIHLDDIVPQVTSKAFQHDTWNSGLTVASISTGHLTSDNRGDIGLLLGMIVFAVMLSILSLIGIFNRSFRTGIKRRILLLIPKWLYEDIPNMKNSNVVKMLQENSELMNNNSSEQVLYVDPMITEIKEIFIPEHKPTDYKKENTGPLETRDYPQNSLFDNTTVVYIPDLNTGYKPQISNFLPEGSHLSNNNEITSLTLKPPVDSLDSGNNPRLQKHPNFAFSVSSVNSLSNTIFLGELSLILNQGECSSPDIQNSVEEETTMLLENDSPSETIPEQTLLPDEFVSCLGIVNEELPSINTYFPQNILESHFNRISLLEK